MKKVTISFSRSAKKQFLHLPFGIQDRFEKKLTLCSNSSKPYSFLTRLKGYNNLYKLRVGNYRAVIFPKIDSQITVLIIVKIGHRKDIYKYKLG